MSKQFSDKDSGMVLLKRRSSVKRAQKDLLRLNYFPVKIPQYDDVYFHSSRPGTSREESQTETKPNVPYRQRN